MFLNIITPSVNPQNIEIISKSINIPKENYRWIVVFDLDEIPEIDVPENCEFYNIKDHKSIYGNAQRNYGLERVLGGFIFFLDDDTLLHPLLWENIEDIPDDFDFVSFDQAWNNNAGTDLSKDNLINKNRVIRTRGEEIKIDHIDSGNYIVNSRIVTKLKWNLETYNSDGTFCVDCFNLSQKRKYIPRIISLHNILDTRRSYLIPIQSGWINPMGQIMELHSNYFQYLNPKIKHIYQNPEFGEPWFRNEKFFIQIVEKFEGGVFVEVGSWKGKSSSFMAVEIANSGKNIEFICVDTWMGSKEHIFEENMVDGVYNIFKSNMEPLNNFYKEIRTTSIEASKSFEDGSIDFIYIDASHEYEDVKDDILHWLPKLKIGGVISGDDYGNLDFPGVHRAVFELLDGYRVSNGTWIYEKV